MPNWMLLWDIIRLLKDHYHWYHLSVLQMLSLLVTPHTMQYWQSISRSVGLAVMCQVGKQKKKALYKYTARHTDIAVWQNDVKKKVLHIGFTHCHLMSEASILKNAPLYVVWELSFPALMLQEQFLEKCTSSRPHGIKSQITFILRSLYSVFAFTLLSFPLNRRACLTISVLYLVNRVWWNNEIIWIFANKSEIFQFKNIK